MLIKVEVVCLIVEFTHISHFACFLNAQRLLQDENLPAYTSFSHGEIHLYPKPIW